MSQLGCECGGVISDNTDNIPYKGAIIRDQDVDAFYENVVKNINAFIDSLLLGKREEWIRGFFAGGYPVDDLKNADIVYDLLASHLLDAKLDIYQCEECGSIKIQEASGSNRFRSFAAAGWKKGDTSILQSKEEKIDT
jgi:hypothetical protein